VIWGLLHATFLGTAVDLRENLGGQQLALLVEVAEGAGEEDPDFPGFGCRRQMFSHGSHAAFA